MKRIKIYLIVITAVALIFNYSCEDYTEDFPVPDATVVAKYSYTSGDEFAPDTITFSNESVVPTNFGTASYFWDFGDGSTSTEENPVHIFLNAGTYSVALNTITQGDTVNYSENITLKSAISGTTLFEEDFEDINVIPSDWVLVNVDGNTPSNPGLASLADSAFIVAYSSTFDGNVALGVSYYDPEAGADDWMILPQITLGANTVLTWDAMSLTTSGNYPDSYQIYVSTTSQNITGCQANGVILSVNPEEVGDDVGGAGITNHQVDLASFANQDVYIAFRLMTPSPGGDRLAIDNIKVVEQ